MSHHLRRSEKVAVVEPGPDQSRIILATIMGPTGATGVQTHIREVSNYLESRGRDVQLVTPYSWGGPLVIPVFGARRVLHHFSGSASIGWYRYWHYIFLRQAHKRELADPRATLIVAQCSLSAKAAYEARRDSSQKIVVNVHSDGSQADEWVDKHLLKVGSREYRSIRETEEEMFPAVDGIVYVSEAARRGMASVVPGIDQVPSAVIHSFLTMPPVEPDVPSRGDLISVGAMEIAKNHEYLVRVLDSANRLGHRYTLDLVGDGPCRRPLEDLVRALGLGDQVRFLGCRSDVRSLLPSYRVYAHSSKRESLCLSIVEAMACGLGVIAGAIGGIPELFEPEREGVFWPLDDPDAAAALLVELLEDLPRLARMGAAGKARFDQAFNAHSVGPVFEEFVASVTDDSPKPWLSQPVPTFRSAAQRARA